MISVTVRFPETFYMEENRKPSPIYQYVINLAVSLPIRRGPGVLRNVSVFYIRMTVHRDIFL